MSPETTATPSQGQSPDGTAEARRSPLRDFLRGASLIFDFRGTIGRQRISTARTPSDVDRLAGDWNAVGEDLRRAMGSRPSHRPAQ